MKERNSSIEEQLQVLESLKPKLGKFIKERLYSWGLSKKDILLVDEAGFGFTGIPIFGPELKAAVEIGQAHIDIAVREEKYTGPKTDVPHPIKINLPLQVVGEISDEYGIGLWDFIKGRSFFDLPIETVNLAGVEVLVPEPVAHVKTFAHDTILYYSVDQVGEDKIKEWFDKLVMIRDVSQAVGKEDAQKMAEKMIKKSKLKWSSRNWNWLSTD